MLIGLLLVGPTLAAAPLDEDEVARNLDLFRYTTLEPQGTENSRVASRELIESLDFQNRPEASVALTVRILRYFDIHSQPTGEIEALNRRYRRPAAVSVSLGVGRRVFSEAMGRFLNRDSFYRAGLESGDPDCQYQTLLVLQGGRIGNEVWEFSRDGLNLAVDRTWISRGLFRDLIDLSLNESTPRSSRKIAQALVKNVKGSAKFVPVFRESFEAIVSKTRAAHGKNRAFGLSLLAFAACSPSLNDTPEFQRLKFDVELILATALEATDRQQLAASAIIPELGEGFRFFSPAHQAIYHRAREAFRTWLSLHRQNLEATGDELRREWGIGIGRSWTDECMDWLARSDDDIDGDLEDEESPDEF